MGGYCLDVPRPVPLFHDSAQVFWAVSQADMQLIGWMFFLEFSVIPLVPLLAALMCCPHQPISNTVLTKESREEIPGDTERVFSGSLQNLASHQDISIAPKSWTQMP